MKRKGLNDDDDTDEGNYDFIVASCFCLSFGSVADANGQIEKLQPDTGAAVKCRNSSWKKSAANRANKLQRIIIIIIINAILRTHRA